MGKTDKTKKDLVKEVKESKVIKAEMKPKKEKKTKKGVTENKENSSNVGAVTKPVEAVKPRVPKDLELVKKPKIGKHLSSNIFSVIKSGFYQNGYSFGLIFMDCSMPILDGYEASDWIRNFVRKENLL